MDQHQVQASILVEVEIQRQKEHWSPVHENHQTSDHQVHHGSGSDHLYYIYLHLSLPDHILYKNHQISDDCPYQVSVSLYPAKSEDRS
uniref:Uncharacterized protein n=1 Tax=Arundo donax TaxID=35708 RepID=A0A0A9DGC7_ARUDO